jgi:hypothetical protein
MKHGDAALTHKPPSSSRSSGPTRSVEEHRVRSRARVAPIDRLTAGPREEALVVDDRAVLRPAQVVESKLMRMIKNASLPVSHLQMSGLLRNR